MSNRVLIFSAPSGSGKSTIVNHILGIYKDQMEFSVSAGFLRTDYRHYQPDPGYEHLFRDKYNVGTVSWFGPTKLKVSLVIPIGKDSHKVNKN